MPEYEIDCVEQDKYLDEDRRIQSIGGPDNGFGQRWHVSLNEAIAGMEDRTKNWSFFVMQNGYKVRVDRYTSINGREYLKTDPDETKFNNLLYLSNCSSK